MRCPDCHQTYPTGTKLCPVDGQRLEVEGGTDPLIQLVVDGRYRIEEQIGGGGMGTVYRAVQLNVGRDVAIKVVNAIALRDPATLRRFETEARIISQLRHPGNLKLIDFGKLPDGRPYLVTEFLKGRSLDRYLADTGNLSPDRTLRLIRDICDALAEAHQMGVIHRDLKPENIFLEEVGDEYKVRVLDFGIAKLGQNSNTATGTVCGTPTYMSPEQAQGGQAEPRSDLYSLGVLAYRCMSGRPPFESEQPLALLLKHIQTPPVPLRQAMGRPDMPYEVEWLVMALLEKFPEQRPASAPEVKLHIDHILTHVLVPSTDQMRAIGGRPLTPALPYPAVSPPTPVSGVPMHFASEPMSVVTNHDPGIMRLLGIGLLAVAVSIVAGAMLWKNEDPLATAVTVEALAPLTRSSKAEPASVSTPLPAEAEVDKAEKPALLAPSQPPTATPQPAGLRKAATPKPTKTVTRPRPRRSDKNKAKKTKDPPPGFMDFDLD